MACMLAKAHRPEIDPRKPYRKISVANNLLLLITIHRQLHHEAQPAVQFDDCLSHAHSAKHGSDAHDQSCFGWASDGDVSERVALLDDVRAGRVSAEDILNECIRLCCSTATHAKHGSNRFVRRWPRGGCAAVVIRGHSEFDRATSSLQRFKPVAGTDCAAAYEAAKTRLGERVLNLTAHNAADEQTGAVGMFKSRCSAMTKW